MNRRDLLKVIIGAISAGFAANGVVSPHAKRVIAARTEFDRVETFIGNGATATFTLQYTLVAHRGYIISDGIYETLLTSDDPAMATWIYSPATNTITRATPPAYGTTTSITFDGASEQPRKWFRA